MEPPRQRGEPLQETTGPDPSGEPPPVGAEVAAQERQPLTFKAEAACYATGFFSLGLAPMMSLAIALWAVTLGAAPLVIGLAVGARSLLPLILSIHGGVVMDRLGVRRVMFWLAGACILPAPLYPALPSLTALVIPVLPGNLDATGSSAVMAVEGPVAAGQSGAGWWRTGFSRLRPRQVGT